MRSVFAGVVHVDALVTGSAAHRAVAAGALGDGIDVSSIPQIDPAEIAETIWTMVTKRDRTEQTLS